MRLCVFIDDIFQTGYINLGIQPGFPSLPSQFDDVLQPHPSIVDILESLECPTNKVWNTKPLQHHF